MMPPAYQHTCTEGPQSPPGLFSNSTLVLIATSSLCYTVRTLGQRAVHEAMSVASGAGETPLVWRASRLPLYRAAQTLGTRHDTLLP